MNSALIRSLPRPSGAYLVGGTVRDLLLDRQPVDYDLAVEGRPEDFADLLLDSVPGRRVVIGKAGQSVLRVITPDATFDICAMAAGGVEADLARRDFTVNAMAVCLTSGRLIDPFGGRSDLTNGLVRMVSDAAFAQDPVRLLRAYRLAAQFDFKIDRHTATSISKEAWRITAAAGERLRDELFKLLSSTRGAGFLTQMADNKLLLRIFPELEPLADCRQPPPHKDNVLPHCLKTVACLEDLLTAPPDFVNPHRGLIEPMNDPVIAADLKCAALLHDIGKPSCRSVDAQGRIHFHGHAAAGARRISRIGRRLRLSSRQTEYIRTVVAYHQRPLLLFNEWRRQGISPRATARLLKACGNLFPDLMLHALADNLCKALPAGREPFERFSCELIDRFYEQFQPTRRLAPLITGHDLIDRFKLKPSRLFKTILDEVDTARLAGSVRTRKEAIEAVEAMLAGISPPEPPGGLSTEA
jgi:tRNA nucleotidyltransferase/poly(A) polymerase